MLRLFLFEALDLEGQFVVGLLEMGDFASVVLDVLSAVEDSLFEIGDGVLVFRDFLDVL